LYVFNTFKFISDMSLLDTASLIVTPNAYKEGKLYSVIPSDGSGDMSVVRATTATRVNSSGLVELVPYNLVQYSEQLDNAAVWVAYSGTTTTANAATAPNGTLTADRIQGATGAFRGVRQSIAFQVSTCTFSVYLKSATGANQNARIWIGATSQVVALTNEWQRFTLTAVPTTATFDIQISTAISASIDVYAWGAQLVEGSTAKDYQKTETRLNIPRLDYSNGTCPSLLVEPQRTNLLTYSSSFDNAAWTPQNISLTTNATTAPDGTTTADKIILNNGSQVNPVVYQISDTTANTRTLSFFAKASEYNIAFGRVGGAASAPIVLFSLTGSGSILHNQNVSAYSIEALANGWYRCSMTYAHGTAFAPNVGVCSATYSVSASNVTSTGNGTSGIFIWGAQLELGSYPTSYIPTTSASVTRNADVISKTGISSLIGQTEGTLFLDVVLKNPFTSINRLFSITETVWNVGGSIRIEAESNKFTADFVNAGSSMGKIEFFTTVQQNTRYKIAVAYKQNDCQMYINGTNAGSDTTTAAMPTCSELYLNALGGGFVAAYDANNINAAALWKTRLTNDELASLTTL
jgi:hypothetical protein